MANTMSKVDLVASLKESLHDSANVFAGSGVGLDVAFERFLDQALPDMQVKCPVTRLGSITLHANFPRYAVGSNPGFVAFKTQIWGDACHMKPWQPGYPGAAPRISASFDANQWWLDFDPAPSVKVISAYGAAFQFWYFARHVIADAPENTTISPQDRDLLILRAQVEAMRELAIRNASKPVTMRDGLSGTPRNSTAAALYKDLMAQFEAVRR